MQNIATSNSVNIGASVAAKAKYPNFRSQATGGKAAFNGPSQSLPNSTFLGNQIKPAASSQSVKLNAAHPDFTVTMNLDGQKDQLRMPQVQQNVAYPSQKQNEQQYQQLTNAAVNINE